MSTIEFALHESKANKGFVKFILPSVLSMVFLSLYTIVDGIFVANYSGPIALAGMNIVLPIFSLAGGLGIMAASGGSALVGIALGEGDRSKANKLFSMVLTSTLALGLVIAALTLLNFKSILVMLGATETLLPYAEIYGKMIVWMIPVFIMKVLLEFFMRIDGNPNLSLILSLSGGIINIVLDWYFMSQLHMGILGAALATAIGSIVSLLIGIWYFFTRSQLKYAFVKWDFKVLTQVFFNGSSEMFTELSTGITTFFFNITAIRLAGETGLAALSVLMYSHFLLMSVFLGFSSGVAPLISYAEGAKSYTMLRLIERRSCFYILVIQAIVAVTALTQAPLLAGFFLNSQTEAFNMTVEAIRLFSVAFLFMGLNIFASAKYTAINNGLKSAVIAIQRSLIGTLIGIAVLPLIFGIQGLWLAVPLAEALAFIVVVILHQREKVKVA